MTRGAGSSSDRARSVSRSIAPQSGRQTLREETSATATARFCGSWPQSTQMIEAGIPLLAIRMPRRAAGPLRLQLLPRVPDEEDAEHREHRRAEDAASGEAVLEPRIEARPEVEPLEQRRALHVEDGVPDERDERDEDASEGAAGDEPRRIEHPRGELALLVAVGQLVG